nr:PP2C family serine/threonine-protein phosphatase [Rhabdochromatium marinum]
MCVETVLTPSNAQWIGARGEQQDAFGFHGLDDPQFRAHGGVLAVLTDGMGGLHQGRAAAQIAANLLRETYAAKPPEEPIPAALERALQTANTAVYELAVTSDGAGQVGTTLVAVVAHDSGIHWVSVGDSRLYGYRAATAGLVRLSQEHNYAAILQARVVAGVLQQCDADKNPDRAALISFIGLERIPRIDAGTDPRPLQPGDRLLLCSDGIHGRLEDDDLCQYIRQPAQQAAEAIMTRVKAVAKSTQDNATLAIVAAEASVPRHAAAGLTAAPSPSPAGSASRQTPPWGQMIIGLGLAVLLVVIGIAIGMSLRGMGHS